MSGQRLVRIGQERRSQAGPTYDMALILDALERLEAKVEAQGHKTDQIFTLLERPAPAPDRDGQLLSAIAFTLGGAAFSAADLVPLAASHDELAAALGGDGVQALALRLRRLAKRPVSGYCLHRSKRENRGQLWTVSVDGVGPARRP